MPGADGAVSRPGWPTGYRHRKVRTGTCGRPTRSFTRRPHDFPGRNLTADRSHDRLHPLPGRELRSNVPIVNVRPGERGVTEIWRRSESTCRSPRSPVKTAWPGNWCGAPAVSSARACAGRRLLQRGLAISRKGSGGDSSPQACLQPRSAIAGETLVRWTPGLCERLGPAGCAAILAKFAAIATAILAPAAVAPPAIAPGIDRDEDKGDDESDDDKHGVRPSDDPRGPAGSPGPRRRAAASSTPARLAARCPET